MSRRTERLGEEIRQEVSLIVGEQLEDPRIGPVTVTRVTVTADLRTAQVYVGIIGDAAHRKRAMAALRQAAGFVRRELGQRVQIRHTPEIVFHLDKGLEATERVEKLLTEIRAEEVRTRDDVITQEDVRTTDDIRTRDAVRTDEDVRTPATPGEEEER